MMRKGDGMGMSGYQVFELLQDAVASRRRRMLKKYKSLEA
jgi:tRNA 2-selenouridine synthase SelU